MTPLVENPVRHKLAQGATVAALTLRQLRTAEAGMIASACGFDALVVDREHGWFSLEATAQICSAALALDIAPLVRLASQAQAEIGAALDAGALGVIVPHVEDAAQAQAAVSATKYPPLGHRSVSALGPATRYANLPIADSLRAQNAATMVIALLESPHAIEHADAIAAVAGIDGLVIGVNDLAAEHGIIGEPKHPFLADAQARVADACRTHGKEFVVAILADDRAIVAGAKRLGCRFFLAGIDLAYLMAAARQGVAIIRDG